MQLRNLSTTPLIRYYVFVIAAHLLGWGAVLWLSTRYPSMIGLGALAYGFGIRHAFDADHISAIDNVTRKLLHSGENPVGTGFFFSLGHSSVVFAVAVLIGVIARRAVAVFAGHLSIATRLGSFLGTGISGVCLLLVGLINLLILIDLFRSRRRMTDDALVSGARTAPASQADEGRPSEPQRRELDTTATGGLMFPVFGRLLRFVRRPRQMLLVGFLFGLGFDTASEVALLAVSAGAAARGLSFLAVLALPTLFAAGMVLMDTSDGALMAKAYGWSAAHADRRGAYNIAMTGVSVACALTIGGVEVLQVAAGLAGGTGAFAGALGGFSSWTVGLACIGLFALIWLSVRLLSRRRLSG